MDFWVGATAAAIILASEGSISWGRALGMSVAMAFGGLLVWSVKKLYRRVSKSRGW